MGEADWKRVLKKIAFRAVVHRPDQVLIFFVILVAMLYIGFALTPSHYAMGLRRLGVSDATPLLLNARGIRSDEWIVLTPLFQTAVRGGFATFNQFSPYHESLKGFWALPILDWSIVFKPQLWGFWVLPPAYAYSLYFAVLWVAFLVGYAVLFMQMGVNVWIAALGALCLFCSGLVQVWWTSNAPTFAFAPWPVIAFLLPIRPWLKLPLLFWACAVWIFALVYPAFIIPAAFAFLVLLIAFRRDAFAPKNIGIGVLALAALGIAFVLYFGDLIATMQSTVYPGQRYVSGGGVNEMRLITHLFPFFTTLQFTPLLRNSNECEIAVVSTLLPMTMLCFVNYQSLLKALENNFVSFCVVATGLSLMLIWMIVPVPAVIGSVFLWTQVPPGRMMWGFGMLLTASVVVFASKCSFILSSRRLAAFVGCMICAWLLSKIGFTRFWARSDVTTWQAVTRSWFDWVVIVPFLVAAVLVWKAKVSPALHVRALFAAAAVSGFITYGTYNPFQQAFPIFNIPETPRLASAREQAKTNPNGWAVVSGNFGAMFSGAGVTAINHVLPAPQLSFFRRIFPSIPEAEFNRVFNRYAHIVPSNVDQPVSPHADVVLAPIAPFLKPPPANN